MVLAKIGTSDEAVDQVIERATNAREWDRKLLLKCASLINRIIVKLVCHGWTIYRATELFFLGMKQLAAFKLEAKTYILFRCDVSYILDEFRH